MRTTRLSVGCRLTSTACWLLLLSGNAHAQRVDVIDEHGTDTAQQSSAPAIGGTIADRGRLSITVPTWPSSAHAIGAEQEALAPTRRDSVLNGVLIGAGVGALVGLIPDHYDDCEECHDSLYASIGVGAGIGLLVDALRVKSPASAPSGRQTSLLLGVGSRAARLRVVGVVRWR